MNFVIKSVKLLFPMLNLFCFALLIFSSKKLSEYRRDLAARIEYTIQTRHQTMFLEQKKRVDPSKRAKDESKLNFLRYLGDFYLDRLDRFKSSTNRFLRFKSPVDYLIRYFFTRFEDSDKIFRYFKKVPKYTVNILDDLAAAKIFQFRFFPQEERKLAQIIASSQSFKFCLKNGIHYDGYIDDMTNFLQHILTFSPSEIPGPSLEETVILEEVFYTFCHEIYKKYRREKKRLPPAMPKDTTPFTSLFQVFSIINR